MRSIKKYLVLSLACVLFSLTLTACGRNASGSMSGNNNTDKNDMSADVRNASKDVADGVKNAADDAVDGAKDIAQGIGNATDDLLGSGGFNNYKDAHDYFLDTMGAYHADARFELRDEDTKLSDYQEGSKGYHFYLYDTSKVTSGERFGEFYVDATNGRIYQRTETGSITEYPATATKVSSR